MKGVGFHDCLNEAYYLVGGEKMTRQEVMEYRRHCPYDAMGDFSELFDEKERVCSDQKQEKENSVDK